MGKSNAQKSGKSSAQRKAEMLAKKKAQVAQGLFSLRDARESDWSALNAYANLEGMDAMPGIDNIVVAVNSKDQVVGFIRIALGANGIAHVNPIVTASTWRGYGVGRALTQAMLEKYGELRLVSRGWSLGFYQALGFDEIPWTDIDRAVVDDCDGCEMYAECRPVPMGKKLSE